MRPHAARRRQTGPPRRVAFSGQPGLDEATLLVVERVLRKRLAKIDQLVGITCLTGGMDQLFARAVLDVGGKLLVVLPADDSPDALAFAERRELAALLDLAFDVVRLRFTEPTAEARSAASRHMLERASELIVVWDGRSDHGPGQPADVVRTALQLRVAVKLIRPPTGHSAIGR